MELIYPTPQTVIAALCGLLLSAVSLTKASVPVITPSSYTAYYGEQNVTFHCFATNASDIVWYVNNASVQHREVRAQGIATTINLTLHESNLTIASTIGNSNIHIECLALSNGSLNFTVSKAVFRVQGVPGECHDVQIISLERIPNHQLLKWKPPSTLNITVVEPDISSYIVCSSISSECTIINVTEAGRDSSDLRQYMFPNLRIYANFTVTAVNIVGDGETTSIVSEPCEQLRVPEKFAAQDLSTVVTFASENKPTLLIEMRSQRHCFDVYKVRLESVEQERGGSRHFQPEMIESGQIIPNVSSDGTLTLNVTTNSTPSANMFYRATLFTAMDMMEAGSILFSTYDVQDVELHGGRRNISIQCEFASGSQARGCHVEIRNSSIQTNIVRSGSPLSQIAEQTVTGLTPGSYEVFIFDWERDGSVASTPSYVGNATVTGPEFLTVMNSTTSPPPTAFPVWSIVVAVFVTVIIVIVVIFIIIICNCCKSGNKKFESVEEPLSSISGTSFSNTSFSNTSFFSNTSGQSTVATLPPSHS